MSNYFVFSGRLNRKRYWLMMLAVYVAFLVVILIFFQAFAPIYFLTTGGTGSVDQLSSFEFGPFVILLSILMAIVYIAATVAGISITVRRLHDRNRSGWWILWYSLVIAGLAIVGGIFGSIVLYVLTTLVILGFGIWYIAEVGFLRGTEGSNQYGLDPLGTGTDAKVFE